MAENLKPDIINGKISAASDVLKSAFTPVKATDVLSRLKRFRFGLLDRIYSVDESDFNYKYYSHLYLDDNDKPSSDIPVISSVADNDILVLSNNNHFDSTVQTFVDECYNKIFGANPMISSEVIFYNSAREYLGLTSELREFELIDTRETYTNRVDIGEVVHLATLPGIVCFADITVQYKKGENIYFRNSIIPAFSYDSDGSLVIKDLKSEITSDLSSSVVDIVILLDAQKYVIEVIPFDPNSNISECIINRCTIKYGKY